jgi:hypothetical protein
MKIKLVTISDDRRRRKGGKYQATQQVIKDYLGDWIEQVHYNINHYDFSIIIRSPRACGQ